MPTMDVDAALRRIGCGAAPYASETKPDDELGEAERDPNISISLFAPLKNTLRWHRRNR
jgi:hypothetical protein